MLRPTIHHGRLTGACASQVDLRLNNLGEEGAKALAPAIRDSSSLTAIDTRCNEIKGEGAEQLAAAVLGSSSMVTFGDVPIQELRADALTTLDLSSKQLGSTEALVLAGLLPVSRSLKQVPASLQLRLPRSSVLTSGVLVRRLISLAMSSAASISTGKAPTTRRESRRSRTLWASAGPCQRSFCHRFESALLFSLLLPEASM